MSNLHRVVILGGGFGGLLAAQGLRRAPVSVTLIDRENTHLFQPLLYQVATGGLSPGDIVSPLRWVLRRQSNATVWLAEAQGFDLGAQEVALSDGRIGYDTLVVATGAGHHYFGHDDWAAHAPGLKTIEDARDIRRRVLHAFEAAEREPDPARRDAWLTFVVVGGGPTGVELAGALSELARDTLRHDFRAIDPSTAKIVLVEGTGGVLPPFPPKLSTACARSLDRLGVLVRTGTFVTGVTAADVKLKSDQGEETLPTRTVLWAAGVMGSPLGRTLASAAGAEVDKAGRVMVEPDLSIAGHANVFVIGDLANVSRGSGVPLPGIAPVAMQQGRYVAKRIARRLNGEDTPSFEYRNAGQLATIGRASAVADFGKYLRFAGYPAWLLWLFIHLMFLVEFQNRVLVLVQWAWHYFTRNRGARIIGRD